MRKDKEVVIVVEKAGVKVLRGDQWQVDRDLILKKEKVYMPKNEKLWIEVIQLHYDILVAEHGRRQKTMELVTRNYWQPGVIKDIIKYIDGYDMCQRIKNSTETPVEKLIANEFLEMLWIYLIVDFITKLPLVVEKNMILVVCDRLFKITYFVITTEETMVERLVRLFRTNVQKLHELLKSVILDRELQFTAKLTKKLNRILDIETKLLISFHLQTDSQTK